MKKEPPFMAIKGTLTPRALLAFFVAASLAVVCSFIYSRWQASSVRKVCETAIRLHMTEATKRLATLATADELDAYREPADMELPGYKALRQKLAEFAKDAGVKYAYYFRVVDGEVRYIVDNDFDEATRSGLDAEPEKASDYAGLEEALGGRAAASPYGAYAPKWTNLASAFAPILDRGGGVAAVCGVDIEDDEVLALRGHGLQSLLLGIVATVMVTASGLYGFLVYRREAAAAQSSNIAKGRFLSRMSHEIRSPMNAVVGMSELALLDYGKPAGVEHIADIKRASNHLLAIINDILDFSALESGRLSIREARYDVASLLNDTLSIVRARLRDKPGVELRLDIDPAAPSALVGDEARVKAVLLNLLTNAAKYTQAGFIGLAVRYRGEGAGGALSFEVSDSGIGIRQEDLGALFADFARVYDKRTLGVQGTGLGLAITRALCRAMGGDVAAESRYGAGSVFTATIRQGVCADAAPMGGFTEDAAPVGNKPWTAGFAAPGFRVLIVDDSATNLKVAKGLLTAYHIGADACLGGAEAVAMVQENEYDLVLMDHMMPGMDGLEALAAMRALGGAFEKLPIAALTANAIAGMKEFFLASGFDDYLSKPIEMPKLGALLERWVPAGKRAPSTERRALVEKLWENRGGVEGLDTAKGLANAGGMLESYREILEVFCLDAKGRTAALAADRAAADAKAFATNVHAIKSAAASIGAVAVSKAAADLEAACMRGDAAFVGESAAGFRDALAGLVERIETKLAEEPIPDIGAGRPKAAAMSAAGAGSPDGPGGAPTLAMLRDALEKDDVGQADRLLEELSALGPDAGTRALLSRVSELALTSDFAEAAAAVAAFVDRSAGG